MIVLVRECEQWSARSRFPCLLSRVKPEITSRWIIIYTSYPRKRSRKMTDKPVMSRAEMRSDDGIVHRAGDGRGRGLAVDDLIDVEDGVAPERVGWVHVKDR